MKKHALAINNVQILSLFLGCDESGSFFNCLGIDMNVKCRAQEALQCDSVELSK